MNIDSIHFKGYSCFKEDWAGFDTIKPINVIIGRNNSGKSHLLDLVEALCKDELFDRGWEYRFGGVLDEGSLKKFFYNIWVEATLMEITGMPTGSISSTHR